MKALARITQEIGQAFPALIMTYDPAQSSTGSDWLDIESNDQRLTIEHQAAQGFGLYTGVENAFGEGPQEIYRNEQALLKRVTMLLFEPRHPITLKTIRELTGKTQQDLSTLMGQRQSSISKFENRTDVQLSTIDNFITALGGRLEIRAHFDDFDLPLNF